MENADLPDACFDICVLRDELHFHQDPVKFLQKIHTIIKPDGILFLTIPSVESLSARIMRQNWFKFKPYHLFYFDKLTIQNALTRAGFSSIHVEPDKKYVSLEYIHKQFKKYRIPSYVRFLSFVRALFPLSVSQKHFNLHLSGMNVICRASELRKRPLLSVVMPVYNERSTFPVVMDLLSKKNLPEMDREIIIVESNSKDGTREEVLKYKDHSGIKIVLEDRPMGKGHAVRAGIEHCSGDFILIQDGDLEYDLNDYDILLEPLLSGRAAFVLGTRHAKGWKIRQFRQFFLADILNLGHWLLAGLMNLLYGQSMSDPFTMYKVFRRDCLFGLKFECNRFNFDIELVCKLLRKGYVPLEVPINYTSRSFSEGKKVKFFSDPPTWLKAIFKYRFIRVYFPFQAPNSVPEKEKVKTC
ncbi:MAG: glycosyltransferase [Elusimicrobia bacterium]|nr:glycosyltransferase [Candidatus Obscuribacterium magneticum]